MVLAIPNYESRIKRLEAKNQYLELLLLSIPDYTSEIMRMRQEINELKTMVY